MSMIERQAAPLEDDSPRYEFRIWSQDFGHLFNCLRTIGRLCDIQGCTDRYIVSSEVTTFSAKIRGSSIDVKQLVERRRPLEKWRAYLKLEFPLDRRTLQATIAPVLALEPERLALDRYSADSFLRAAVARNPSLACVTVQKTRFLFSVGGCRAEYTAASVAGSMLDTVAIEGPEPAAVLRLITRLGLRDHENLDYPRAIRRYASAGAPGTLAWTREPGFQQAAGQAPAADTGKE